MDSTRPNHFGNDPILESCYPFLLFHNLRHSLKEETEKLRQANPKLFQQSTPSTGTPVDGSSPVPSKKRKSASAGGTPTSRQEESVYKIIKFGTNVDLSDERKCKNKNPQIISRPMPIPNFFLHKSLFSFCSTERTEQVAVLLPSSFSQ